MKRIKEFKALKCEDWYIAVQLIILSETTKLSKKEHKFLIEHIVEAKNKSKVVITRNGCYQPTIDNTTYPPPGLDIAGHSQDAMAYSVSSLLNQEFYDNLEECKKKLYSNYLGRDWINKELLEEIRKFKFNQPKGTNQNKMNKEEQEKQNQEYQETAKGLYSEIYPGISNQNPIVQNILIESLICSLRSERSATLEQAQRNLEAAEMNHKILAKITNDSNMKA